MSRYDKIKIDVSKQAKYDLNMENISKIMVIMLNKSKVTAKKKRMAKCFQKIINWKVELKKG